MRHLGLLAILLVLFTPVINLSAIPLFLPTLTAAQHVAMRYGRSLSSRACPPIETLHIAAVLRVGIAQKVLCIVAQCP